MSTICHPLRRSRRREQQVVINSLADSWPRWRRGSGWAVNIETEETVLAEVRKEGSRWKTNIARLLSPRNRFVCLLINFNWQDNSTQFNLPFYKKKIQEYIFILNLNCMAKLRQKNTERLHFSCLSKNGNFWHLRNSLKLSSVHFVYFLFFMGSLNHHPQMIFSKVAQ